MVQSSPSETDKAGERRRGFQTLNILHSTHTELIHRTFGETLDNIRSLYLILLNLHRTMAGTAWAEHEYPQRSPLPLPFLFLSASHLRFRQTTYRPVLHILRLFPQYLFFLFRGIHATAAPSPPAQTHQGRGDDGNTCDLECMEIWERFARNDQF